MISSREHTGLGCPKSRLGGWLRVVPLVLLTMLATADSTAEHQVALYVFAPTLSSSSTLEHSLERALESVNVVVFTRVADLRAVAEATPPDGILALPVTLAVLGRSPSIQGKLGGSALEGYSLLRRTSGGNNGTVGALDVVGPREFPSYARSLLGSHGHALRRVAKAADLLPLLQFDMAEAVVINDRLLEALTSRSTLAFTAEPLPGSPLQRVAVSLSSGKTRAQLEAALLRIPETALAPLGVDSWEVIQ